MKTLVYKNINIAYTDSGKGPAIVLLHGFLENLHMWKALTPELIKTHRVIAIDLLGHGKTECLGYIHSMEDMADAVRAVLVHLKLRKYTFIGHSMGGYVALAYAEFFPDNLKGLVLLNSTSKADSNERKQNRTRAIKAVKQNYRTFISMSIANLFAEENRVPLAKAIEQVKKEALKTPIQGIIAALEGMKARPDREALLHFTPYKKMIVAGRKDPILNINDVRAQTVGTSVELVELADGHMSHIENTKDLSYIVKRFIEK
ncbi:MAG: alpha/beta hydrolase [Algicola sp.]|nr:alpha/beta hydrolase [Algicola sp.]